MDGLNGVVSISKGRETKIISDFRHFRPSSAPTSTYVRLYVGVGRLVAR